MGSAMTGHWQKLKSVGALGYQGIGMKVSPWHGLAEAYEQINPLAITLGISPFLSLVQ